MKRLLLALVLLFGSTGTIFAQSKPIMMPFPGDFPDGSMAVTPETHSYTYVVKDDGSATVWFRAEGVQIPKKGGEFRLQLPAKVSGDVHSWYRENGCLRYSGTMCTYYGGDVWHENKVTVTNGEAVVTIPARDVSPQDEKIAVSVGLSFGISDVTMKKWLGREVTITTGKPTSQVSYLTIGVYLPDGIYSRDKQQGPQGWGSAIAEIAAQKQSAVTAQSDRANFTTAAPAAFNYVGVGEIVRSRPNLSPGEAYSFRFSTATSLWKLYAREIGGAVLILAGIAAVLALLLFMLVGKKPLWWFLTVMLLILILLILMGSLWLTYRLNFASSTSSYPIRPLMMDTKVNSGSGSTGVAVPPQTIPEGSTTLVTPEMSVK